LKYRFHYYSNMAMSTDQEKVIIEEIVRCPWLPRGASKPCPRHAGLVGEAPGSVRRQRSRGNGAKGFVMDAWEGRGNAE
jgi:hypothetical protein